MKMTLPILVFCLIFPLGVFAEDLGIHGRVYPIEERSLLEVIKAKAQAQVDSGKWDKQVDEWKIQAKAQANRPKAIKLPRAKEKNSRLHDPSIIVPEDIKDANGILIHPAGKQINPLSYITMSRKLIFIDGDDKQQVEWMMEMTNYEPDKYKVILTSGPVLDLMNELQRRLYFDQHQQLINKLNLQHLPSLVYQHGLYLRIDEVVL